MTLAGFVVVAVLIALLIGGFSHRDYHAHHEAVDADYYWGWSPLAVIVVVILMLWATGHL